MQDSAEEDEIDGLEGLHCSPPKEIVQGPSGKIYESTSMFVLKVADEPRRSAIKLVESPLFDPLILLTIVANCVTMAWESPLDPSGTWKSAFIDGCEWSFLFIFTFEVR